MTFMLMHNKVFVTCQGLNSVEKNKQVCKQVVKKTNCMVVFVPCGFCTDAKGMDGVHTQRGQGFTNYFRSKHSSLTFNQRNRRNR